MGLSLTQYILRGPDWIGAAINVIHLLILARLYV